MRRIALAGGPGNGIPVDCMARGESLDSLASLARCGGDSGERGGDGVREVSRSDARDFAPDVRQAQHPQGGVWDMYPTREALG